MDFDKGKCWIRDKKWMVIGEGEKYQRLYLLRGRAILQEKEQANYASMRKLTWDQWHHRYGHISNLDHHTSTTQKGRLSQWTKYRPIFDPIKDL